MPYLQFLSLQWQTYKDHDCVWLAQAQNTAHWEILAENTFLTQEQEIITEVTPQTHIMN